MHSGMFPTLRDVLEFYDDVSGRRGRARNGHVTRDQLNIIAQAPGVVRRVSWRAAGYVRPDELADEVHQRDEP